MSSYEYQFALTGAEYLCTLVCTLTAEQTIFVLFLCFFLILSSLCKFQCVCCYLCYLLFSECSLFQKSSVLGNPKKLLLFVLIYIYISLINLFFFCLNWYLLLVFHLLILGIYNIFILFSLFFTICYTLYVH